MAASYDWRDVHRCCFSVVLPYADHDALWKKLAEAPEGLQKILEFALNQARATSDVISRFGRAPHRNAVLGRPSSTEETAYVAESAFVHMRKPATSA